MTTSLPTDDLAADEAMPGPIAPPEVGFGEIGIAAVAGALAASRPAGAEVCSSAQKACRPQQGGGADAASESLTYEISNT